MIPLFSYFPINPINPINPTNLSNCKNRIIKLGPLRSLGFRADPAGFRQKKRGMRRTVPPG